LNSRFCGALALFGGRKWGQILHGGDHAFALLGVEIDTLLASGFSNVGHAGKGHGSMLRVTCRFLLQAFDEFRIEPLVAPNCRAAADGLDRTGD